MTDPAALPLLGKKKAKFMLGLPALGKYTLHLTPSPLKLDYNKAPINLGQMCNDKLGCCTISGVGHLIQEWTALTQPTETIISDATIRSLYSKWCGYVDGDPYTDNGGIAADVLRSWYQQPIEGHTLDGFAAIRPGNRGTIRDAIYLFGGAYVGVQLPISAQNGAWDRLPDAPLTGDNAPGSWGGHAIPLVPPYDEKWLHCITWGGLKPLSWDWLDPYMDEGFGCLSKDFLDASGRTPAGFDWATVQADMQAIRAS